MANQIRIPTIEELKKSRTLTPAFDSSLVPQQYAAGMTLQDTILQKQAARQQAEEELKKEIMAAKELASQQQRVEQFRQAPNEDMAVQAYPEQQAKKLFEKPQVSFSKVGETDDEIIMANLADPTQVQRISAPGVGKKSGKAGSSGTFPSALIGNLLKTKGTGDFIDNLRRDTSKMGQKSGLLGMGQAGVTKFHGATKGFFVPKDKKTGAIGDNASVIAYEESRPTMGRAIYKFFSGDVGNISENEGKFAVNLLPTAYEDPGIREAKIARLEHFKEKAEAGLAETLQFVQEKGLGPDELGELVKQNALKIMQEASMAPLSDFQQSPGMPEAPAAQPNAGSTFKLIGRRPSGGQ